MTLQKKGFSTNSVHSGEKVDFINSYGDVVVPIHLSSTYARKVVEHPEKGYQYARCGNPTRTAFDEKLATLENAQFGMSFASGIGAISTLLFALLKSGDHIIGFDDLYGGTKRLLNDVMPNFGIKVTYTDATNPALIEQAITKDTKIIWLESPTNPLLKLCDLEQIASIAKRHSILTVVDNTFMTPYFMKPLDLGIDIVVHSTTKYIGGHSDIIGGAVLLNDELLFKKVSFFQNAIGAVPSPFDSYLALRGLKTLAVRMEVHNKSAIKIANYLEKNPKIEKVYYPGLASHPQHELAKKQATGFGAIITFKVKGGLKEAKLIAENLELVSLAESLGGVESLIQLPYLMTHASVPVEQKVAVGITENMIRFSVGLEDVDDLISDFENVFKLI
ncbi:MAG: PLP-dependent transferase [Bacteroidales bacterium]|nr:PLP-dependent transferase [Bacteroidales bacterium]